MFPNVQKKLEAFSKLDELAKEGKEKVYDHIYLYNERYKLNVQIDLLFKVAKQTRLQGVQSSGLSDIYIIQVDVPVKHESLEGKFDVKEYREVYLVHFADPQLENVAIMSTEHSSRARE